MGRIIDLTGKKFGRLTVIGPTDKRNHRKVLWECRCDCGNTCYEMGYVLKNGDAKSCGCLQAEQRMKMGLDNGITKKLILNDTINVNNRSGVKGVFWNTGRSKWVARIRFDYQYYTLYYGDSFWEAVKARERGEEAVADGTFLSMIDKMSK